MDEINDRFAAGVLSSASAEIAKKRDETLRLAERRETAAATMKDVVSGLESLLVPALSSASTPGKDPALALRELIGEVRRGMAGVRSLAESLSSETLRVKGVSEGLQSAALLVEEIGNARLREAERVEALAASGAALEGRRRPGERPEALRVKRKAAALRENLSSGEGDSDSGEDS